MISPFTLRYLAIFGLRHNHPILRIGTYLFAGKVAHKKKGPAANTRGSDGLNEAERNMVRVSARNRAYKAALRAEGRRVA